MEEALVLQNKINEIIYTLVSGHGNLYAMMKKVIEKRNQLECDGVRAPLVNVNDSDMAIVDKVVNLIELGKN